MADHKEVKEKGLWVIVQVSKIGIGHNGPYAFSDVAYVSQPNSRLKEKDTITFGLGKSIWKEELPPSPGSFVILQKFELKSEGKWRALSARRLEPNEENIPEWVWELIQKPRD